MLNSGLVYSSSSAPNAQTRPACSSEPLRRMRFYVARSSSPPSETAGLVLARLLPEVLLRAVCAAVRNELRRVLLRIDPTRANLGGQTFVDGQSS